MVLFANIVANNIVWYLQILFANIVVHTDLNSETVLEEGVGYLKVLLVAFKLPDGKISIGAGPVLSYYEFKQPMNDRLNDELWKKLLNSDSCPQEPEWISEYSV